jgi:hypothetical protein
MPSPFVPSINVPNDFCRKHPKGFFHYHWQSYQWSAQDSPRDVPPIVSGGRPEGSKRNLKFLSAMWHHFKHFQSKDFFSVAFLSQHLNYSVIIMWKILN